jgi:hypothetical protein
MMYLFIKEVAEATAADEVSVSKWIDLFILNVLIGDYCYSKFDEGHELGC